MWLREHKGARDILGRNICGELALSGRRRHRQDGTLFDPWGGGAKGCFPTAAVEQNDERRCVPLDETLQNMYNLTPNS